MKFRSRRGAAALLLAAFAAGAVALLSPLRADAQAVPVKVTQQNGRWTLLRGGKPYFVRGAGGSKNLEQLKAAGGNSIRGWGAENAQKDLDAAQKHGMTMTLGIWLGHPQHGFKYDDPKMVAEQQAKSEEVARKHKGHPALLVWGIGNEMEMASGGKDDNVWRAVENIAKAIKKIDPDHPTMTVIAEIGEDGIKAKKVRELCPSIDVLGVNAYGGLASLPERLKAAGWTKPYVVTEFGPPGPWEVGKTEWGAALEPTSTAKTDIYLNNYQKGVGSQPGWCLGSYTFLWENKFEGTATWFGMFLPGTNEKLGPVDAMTYAWTGKWPATRAPRLVTFASTAANKAVAPGSSQTVTAVAEPGGPAAGALTYRYELRPDTEGPSTFEPGQKPKDAVAGLAPAESAGGTEKFTAPATPGAYRLFVYVSDGKGGAATANFPFRVEGAKTATK